MFITRIWKRKNFIYVKHITFRKSNYVFNKFSPSIPMAWYNQHVMNRFEKLNVIVKDIQQYENGLPKLVVKHFSLEKFRIRFART